MSFCETLRNDLTVRVTGSPNGTEQRADVASRFMRAARVRVRYSSRSFRRHHGLKLERMNAERSHGAACCVRRWRRTSFSAATVARCIWQPLPNGGVKYRPAGCTALGRAQLIRHRAAERPRPRKLSATASTDIAKFYNGCTILCCRAYMIKVSVVIPAYNAAPYLPDAIRSIINQTFREIEILIIDDCSADETWRIIQEFASREPRIRAYHNSRNLGISSNRNKGVSLAVGKYLAWQDADDISLPTRIERQYELMELQPRVGIVGGYIELFDEANVFGIRKYPSDDASLRRCIFRYSPVAQPAAMVRMDALRRVGKYNSTYLMAEDLDMTFRIGEHYQLANLEEVIVRYRLSDSSATFTRLRTMELTTLRIRHRYFSSSAYYAGLGDAVYNILHFFSVWIIPSRMKIRLFNWFRGGPSTKP